MRRVQVLPFVNAGRPLCGMQYTKQPCHIPPQHAMQLWQGSKRIYKQIVPSPLCIGIVKMNSRIFCLRETPCDMWQIRYLWEDLCAAVRETPCDIWQIRYLWEYLCAAVRETPCDIWQILLIAALHTSAAGPHANTQAPILCGAVRCTHRSHRTRSRHT